MAVFDCGHYGNTAPFSHVTGWEVQRGDDLFYYRVLRCHTCDELTVVGGLGEDVTASLASWPRLYPATDEVTDDAVPEPIRNTYGEASRIRRRAPNAYAVQIRRALEYLCRHREAKGRNLAEQLRDLARVGVLPATIEEMTAILRVLGNVGAHAGVQNVEPWQADLIDEFFRWVIEYVYIAPARIQAMKKGLEEHMRDEGGAAEAQE